MNNATSYPAQPLGYINSRLAEAVVSSPFKRVQLVSYVVEPNTAGERGAHPEYLGAKVTKADQVSAQPGEVICYERTVNGYDTVSDMQSGDTAYIAEETAASVYLKLAKLNDSLVWVELPAHKIAEAGGDPYKVNAGFYAKQGRYLPC